MAFTVGEAVRLERSLLTEGAAQSIDSDSLIREASAWFVGEQPRARSILDSETFAFLCETIRFPRDATVRALAAGALRIAQRDGHLQPHRAGFAARFAAKRIRALSGTAALWSAIPLSPADQADAQALFDAAHGDSSYSDAELNGTATNFITQHASESTMFGRLAKDLSHLVGVLADREGPSRSRDIARAALTYFAVAEDAIPDHRGFVGLLDDVYVVQRAVAEVCPQRGAIVSLLDNLVRHDPFVRDIVFDVGATEHPLSEFSLVNSSLLLDKESCGPSVALVVPSVGPLPLLIGFMGALAEVHRSLSREGWPEFIKGELLINAESGAGVMFESYGRLTGKTFSPSPPSEATHVCFFARPVGRDKSRATYNVKCFRAVEDVVSFKRAQSAHRAHGGSALFDRDTVRLGVLERLFGSSKPVVLAPDRERIVVVSQLGEAREALETLTIFRSPLLDVLPTGQAQILETGVEYRTWTKTNDGYGPLLTFVRSTADAAVLCDDPNSRVGAVIAQIRPDSSDATNVARISGRGVRVIAVLEQRHIDGIEHLQRAGFNCWAWDEAWLNTVYWPHPRGGTNPILDYEHRLREQVSARPVTAHLVLPGVSSAYSALRNLQTLGIGAESELLHLLLGEGFGLLLHLCRLATPLNGQLRTLGARLQTLRASVDRGAKWWSDEIVQLTTTMLNELDQAITALERQNPKFHAIREWVASHPDGEIVCGRSFRHSLRSHLGSTRVNLVDRPSPLASAALVPAWLQKDRMSRLLFPLITPDLTLLLYEPEIAWHKAANVRYLNAINQARTFATERPTFRAIRQNQPPSIPPPTAPTELPAEPDNFVTAARRAQALNYLRSVGGESVSACLVQFVGGYWAAFTQLHRVHTVTHLLGSERRGDEEIRETVVSELRVGDLILLLRDTDRDALREEVDAVAPAGSREAAAAWQRALKRHAADLPVQELVATLAKAGCLRTTGTVERWLEDDSMIGPRGVDDVRAILAVTRDLELNHSLTSCLAAIALLRGLHVSVARTLATRVLDRARQWLDAGAVPDELIEVEDRLVLATVESIDGSLVDVARSIANRLQEDRWPI